MTAVERYVNTPFDPWARKDSSLGREWKKLPEGVLPNRHVAFGSGINYCLGAPLARLEGRIVLQGLLAPFPSIEVAVSREQIAWTPGFFLRGVRSLPVTVGRP